MYLRLQLWLAILGIGCVFSFQVPSTIKSPPYPPPKKKKKNKLFFLRGNGDVSENYHLDTPIKKGQVMAQLPNPHLKIFDFQKKTSPEKKTPLNNRQGSAKGLIHNYHPQGPKSE